MGKGHVCDFSQDKTEAQLIRCVEPKNTDPDAAEDNPGSRVRPTGPVLLTTWFTSCCLGRRGDCGQSMITQPLDRPATQEFQIT